MRRRNFAFAAFVSGVALAACSLAPDYKVPEVQAPQSYKETGVLDKAQPAEDSPRGPWWTIFKDPQLDALEDKVTEANQNLKVALAQYQEARAAADAARADLFPTVTGNIGATRQRESPNTANSPGKVAFNDFSMGA